MFYKKEDRDKLNMVIDFISKLTDTQVSLAENMKGVTNVCKEQNDDMHQIITTLEEVQRVRSDVDMLANISADPAKIDAILHKAYNIEDKLSGIDEDVATKIGIMHNLLCDIYHRIEQTVSISIDQAVIERKIRRTRRNRATGRYSHRLPSVADHRRFK